MANAPISRRRFLRNSAFAAAPLIVPGRVLGLDGGVAPSSRIRFGLIGYGPRAQSTLPVFLSFPDIAWSAVSDCRADRLHAAKQAVDRHYGNADCRAYADFQELLAQPDIDAVMIATGNRWHGLASIYAARAGKDIYCEKPISLSIQEGRAVVEACRQFGTIYQGGTQRRATASYQFAREMVRQGRIGNLRHVEMQVWTGAAIPHEAPGTAVPEGWDYDRWLGQAPWRPFTRARTSSWQYFWETAEGMLSDMGCHYTDQAQWTLGTDRTGPVDFETTGVLPDPEKFMSDTPITAEARCTYAGGITATMYQRRGFADRYPPLRRRRGLDAAWTTRPTPSPPPTAALLALRTSRRGRLVEPHRPHPRPPRVASAPAANRSATPRPPTAPMSICQCDEHQPPPRPPARRGTRPSRAVRLRPRGQPHALPRAPRPLEDLIMRIPLLLLAPRRLRRHLRWTTATRHRHLRRPPRRSTPASAYCHEPTPPARAEVEEELLGVLRHCDRRRSRRALRRATPRGRRARRLPGRVTTNLTASARPERAHARLHRPDGSQSLARRRRAPCAPRWRTPRVPARLQIVNALGRRAEPESVPLLAPLASDSDPTLAAAARVALARIPGSGAAAALFIAPRLPEADLLYATREKNLPVLEKLLRNGGSASVRRGAWNALADADPAGLLPRILAALTEGDPVIAPLAAATAGRLTDPAATAALAEALPKLAHPARGWLIAALADLGGTPALAALQQELVAGDPDGKLAAATALRRRGDAATAPALAAALRGADAPLAESLTAALIDLPPGDPADSGIRGVLCDAATADPVRLIDILSARNAAGAMPDLWAPAASTNAPVAAAAWKAISRLATPADLPRLLELTGQHPGAEAAAARVLGRMPDPAARSVAVTTALAAATDPAARATLVRLLGVCAADDALARVVVALADADAGVRDAAARTLAAWPTGAARDPLLALMRTPPSPGVRALALRGLVRLAAEPTSPDESPRARFEPLLAAAATPDERKLILGAIAKSGRSELLPLLKPLLQDDAVRAEAESARAALVAPPPGAKPLFDGKTLAGWEGDTAATWRVEDGAIVAGALDRQTKDNQYLATTASCGDFDLQLQYRLTGTEGFVNGGIQFRSERRPHPVGMAGYQADLGAGYDGALYDEHRRNKVLARPSEEIRKAAVIPDGWNHYRIRAEGPRVRLWLNGVLTVDYTEPDDAIPRRGVIAVQIHGNAKSRVAYRGLHIEELP
jgi:predicted dehydrogenase